LENASVEVLTMLSRALERAIRAVPNKPRADVTTADLANAIEARAAQGLRDEVELADHALQHLGIAR
jgi:hypothetical protein